MPRLAIMEKSMMFTWNDKRKSFNDKDIYGQSVFSNSLILTAKFISRSL